jgi:chemotaxis protein CheD
MQNHFTPAGSAAAASGGKRFTQEAGKAESISLEPVYLHPGQDHVSATPVMLKMILGSCIGVFLFDARRGFGGATHFLLPEWQGIGRPSTRYGDVATLTLIKKMQGLGSKNADIQAKVFGGGCMFDVFRGTGGENIGSRNLSMALSLLSRESIPVTQKDALGDRSRKVSMVSNTGEITLVLLGEPNGR